MAQRDLWHTTQLHGALTDRAAMTGGRTWSKPQIYRLVAGRPDRLSLELLDTLCDVLGCTPGDLLVHTREGDA
ncbi:hypothetical protein ASD30_25600 [Nocardioides sp. Root140]|nr:hypothetical protein ASD30_25600 [Nocardioides sp. Root140]